MAEKQQCCMTWGYRWLNKVWRSQKRLEAVKQTSVFLGLRNPWDFINASVAGEARGPAILRNEAIETLDGFVFLIGKPVVLTQMQWPGVNTVICNTNAVMQIVCFRDQLPLGDSAPGLVSCDHPGRLSFLCYSMLLPRACENWLSAFLHKKCSTLPLQQQTREPHKATVLEL